MSNAPTVTLLRCPACAGWQLELSRLPVPLDAFLGGLRLALGALERQERSLTLCRCLNPRQPGKEPDDVPRRAYDL